LQLAGNFGFTRARAVKLPDLISVAYRNGSTQALAVLACMRQTSADSFAENLSLEFRVLRFTAKRG